MNINIRFPFIFIRKKRLEDLINFNRYAQRELTNLRTRILCLEEENKNFRYNYENVKTLLKEQQTLTREQAKTIYQLHRKIKRHDTTIRT